MNQFKIIAHGENFDVDAFLAGVSLSPSKLWHKGDVLYGHKERDTSGFEIALGDGETLDNWSQQKIASEFIMANFQDLKSCGNCHGMQHYKLFIQEQVEITPDVCGIFTRLAPELLKLTILVKMEAVTYVQLVRLDRLDSDWYVNSDT